MLVLPSPQVTAVTVKSLDGALLLASVKVALDSVAAVTPSTPPVALAALLPVRAASATTGGAGDGGGVAAVIGDCDAEVVGAFLTVEVGAADAVGAAAAGDRQASGAGAAVAPGRPPCTVKSPAGAPLLASVKVALGQRGCRHALDAAGGRGAAGTGQAASPTVAEPVIVAVLPRRRRP